MVSAVQTTELQSIALLLSLLIALVIGRRLSFSQLHQQRSYQHIVFGSAAALCLLWAFQTGIAGSPKVHFLWLAAMPLILGFRWSVFSSALALLGLTLMGIEPVNMLGMNFLLGCLAPICLTYGIYSLCFHKLPKNVFVYIFLCAFIPGALTIALKMLLLSGYYYFDGIYQWGNIVDNYLQLVTLLAFPEAMFNGMTITLLIIYKPHWVYTYYDKYYLAKK